MSLVINFSNPKEFVVHPAQTITTKTLTVHAVLDKPQDKIVVAIVEGLGNVIVEGLSGPNYNNPPWTDDALVTALKIQLGNS